MIEDADFAAFSADPKNQLAVWKSIEIVGEAAGQVLKREAGIVGDDLLHQLRLAYAMRNRHTHGYPGVDLTALWTTGQEFIPSPVQDVEPLLETRAGDA